MRFGRLFDRFHSRAPRVDRRRRRQRDQLGEVQRLEERAMLAIYYHGIDYSLLDSTPAIKYFNYEVSVTNGSTLYARYEANTGYVIFSETESFSNFTPFNPTQSSPSYGGVVRPSYALNIADRVSTGQSFALPVSGLFSTFKDGISGRTIDDDTFIAAGINIVGCDDGTGAAGTGVLGSYNNRFVLSAGQQLPVWLDVYLPSDPDASNPDTSSILLKGPTQTATPKGQLRNLALAAASIEVQATGGTGNYRARDSIAIKANVGEMVANVSDGNFLLNAGATITGAVDIRLGFSGTPGAVNAIGSGGTGGDILIDGKISAAGNSLLQVNSTSRPCNILTGASGEIAGSGSLTLWNAGLDGGRIAVTTGDFTTTAFQAGSSLPNNRDPNIAISVEQKTGDLTVESVPSSSAGIALKATAGAVKTTSNIVTRASLTIDGQSLSLTQPISTIAGPITLLSKSDITIGSDVQAGTAGVGDLTIKSSTGFVKVDSSAVVSAVGESISISAATNVTSLARLIADTINLTAAATGNVGSIDVLSRANTVSATSRGSVSITDDDELSVTNVVNAVAGGVTIKSGGRLEVSNVAVAGAGDIVLQATAGGLLVRDMQAAALGVKASAGGVSMSTGLGDIEVQGGIAAAGTGKNIGVVASDGNIVLRPTATVSVPTGNFNVSAAKGRVFTPGSIGDVTVDPAATGEWYASAPGVSVTAGSGATATPVLNDGRVTNVKVLAGGAGYTGSVTVQFVSRDGNGTNAAATAIVAGGAITGIVITNPGQGYTQAPEVRLVGTGSGAYAEGSIDGVTAVLRSAPTIIVDQGGTGYDPATVTATIAPPTAGKQATATVSLGLTKASFAPAPGGTGYKVGDLFDVTGGINPGQIKVTQVDGVGAITNFTVEQPGSGFTVAAITVTKRAGVTGMNAAFSPNHTNFTVVGINVTDPGTGYTSEPAVTITSTRGVSGLTVTNNGGTGYSPSSAGVVFAAPPAGGVPAIGTPLLGLTAQSLSISNAGAGYVVGDRLEVTGGGGSGAVIQVATLALAGGIATFTVVTPGSGFTSAPTGLSRITGAGAGATITGVNDQFQIVGATVTNGGTGYAAAPAVTFTSGVTKTTVPPGGSGYSANTQVTFSPPSAGGTTATGTVSLGLANASMAIAPGGAGTNYVNPQVLFQTPVNGTAASGTVQVAAGVITGITVTTPGGGYTSAPVVTVTSGVSSVTVPAGAGGEGYSPDTTVTFSAPDSPLLPNQPLDTAQGSVELGLTQSSVQKSPIDGGAGYAVGDILTVVGGLALGGVAATLRVTGVDVVGGAIASADLQSPGSGYLSAPTGVSGGTGAGASFAFNAAHFTIAGIKVTNPGSGYTQAPTITISAAGITSATVTEPGRGYALPPAVSFTAAAGGTDASGQATLGITLASISLSGGTGFANGDLFSITNEDGGSDAIVRVTSVGGTGAITGFAIDNPGSGFLTAPSGYGIIKSATGNPATLVFSANDGNFGIASILITNSGAGQLNPLATIAAPGVPSVSVVDGGAGYTQIPTVTLSTPNQPGGTLATATALLGLSAASVTVVDGGTGYSVGDVCTVWSPDNDPTHAALIRVESISGTGAIQTVSIQAPGSGWDGSTPVVDVTGGWHAGSPAQFAFSFKVVGIVVTNRGSGYTAAPTVTIDKPGVASATPVLPGTGFSQATAKVIFSDPPAGGVKATGTVTVTNGQITAITITSPGSGYTSAPTATFTSGVTGTSPSAPGGSGYKSSSVVTFSAPTTLGGVTATGTVAVTSGQITGITITSPGSGYTSAPTITIQAPGVVSATQTSAGSGYVAGTVQVAFSAPPAGGTPATGTATVVAGQITVITVTDQGSGYTAVPTITITSGVTAATVSINGSGYSGSTGISFSAPTAAGGVTATGTVSLGVTKASFAAAPGGTLYKVGDTFTVTGGTTPGKITVTAVSGTGAITNFNVTPGVGFTSAPGVSVDAGVTGSGASFSPNNTKFTVVGVTVINPGSGYTSAPTVTFTNRGSGTGATATASVGTGAAFTANLGTAATVPTATIGTGATASVVLGTGATATASVGQQATATSAAGNLATIGAGAIVAVVGSGANIAGNANNFAIVGINVTNTGSGYTAAPTISATAPGLTDLAIANVGSNYVNPGIIFSDTAGPGAGAAGSVTQVGGQINSVTLTAPGQGYATAIARVTSGVSAIAVNANGSGYALGTRIRFDADPSDPNKNNVVPASADAVAPNGFITGYTNFVKGSGYTRTPTATLLNADGSPATGSGAVIIATIGSGATITVTQGTPVVPTATIGTGATATSTLAPATGAGAAATASISLGGSGYQIPPQVVVISSGSGATTSPISVDADGAITSINVSVPGSNYLVPPTVQITPANNTGFGASAEAVLSTGVTSTLVTSGGTGLTATTAGVTFAAPTTPGGQAATGTASLGLTPTSFTLPKPAGGTDQTGFGYRQGDLLAVVAGTGAQVRVDSVGVGSVVTIAAGGTGYSGATTGVSFSVPGVGVTATGTVSLGVTRASFAATPGGTGYKVGDTFTVTGGTTAGEIKVTQVDGFGAITNFSVEKPGSGFTTLPINVAQLIVTPGAAGAAFAPNATNFTVVGVKVTNPGSGYTSLPTVTFTTPGTGSGAVAVVSGCLTSTGFTILDGGLNYSAVNPIVNVVTQGLGYVGNETASFTASPSGGIPTATGDLFFGITPTTLAVNPPVAPLTGWGVKYVVGDTFSVRSSSLGANITKPAVMRVSSVDKDGGIKKFTMADPGSGFTNAFLPDLFTYNGTLGSGFTAGAAVTYTPSQYCIVGVTVTNPTLISGYTSNPTVTISGGNTSFTSTTQGFVRSNTLYLDSGTGTGAQFEVSSVVSPNSGSITLANGLKLNNAGNGYTPGTILTHVGGTGGLVRVTTDPLHNDVVIAMTVVNPGSGYRTAPSGLAGGSGSGASALFNDTKYQLVGVTVVSPGSGYTAAPTITVTTGGGTATATSTISKYVSGFTIKNPGSGYDPAQTTVSLVPVSGGGGSLSTIWRLPGAATLPLPPSRSPMPAGRAAAPSQPPRSPAASRASRSPTAAQATFRRTRRR